MVAGSPRASSQWRSAPATMVNRTSFTVPRSERRILRTSGRGRSSVSKRRCGPMGRFSADGGASPIPASPQSGLKPPAISRSSFRASLFACSASRTTWNGLVICSLSEMARSSDALGAGRGCHSKGEGGGSLDGSVSIRTVARSTPEMPSSMQWCVFEMMAKRSLSRPSTSHISQSGLSRSSAWEKSRPTSFFNSASPPGAGSAVWRT